MFHAISLAAPYENVSSGICGQRRLRSDCISAQSNRGLRRPLIKLFGQYRIFIWRANARMILRMRRMNLCIFVHSRRDIFAWRGPFNVLYCHIATSDNQSSHTCRPVERKSLCQLHIKVDGIFIRIQIFAKKGTVNPRYNNMICPQRRCC